LISILKKKKKEESSKAIEPLIDDKDQWKYIVFKIVNKYKNNKLMDHKI